VPIKKAILFHKKLSLMTIEWKKMNKNNIKVLAEIVRGDSVDDNPIVVDERAPLLGKNRYSTFNKGESDTPGCVPHPTSCMIL
jgi:hypothetical protein